MNFVRKKHGKILAGLLLSALFAVAGAGALDYARAESPVGTDASLFLPSSYEQYLELESPKDVAINDKHIAIADGDTLYIYGLAEKTYISVTLTAEQTLAKLGFADDRLFVATTGVSNSFYEYNYEEKKLNQFPTINCSTFLIGGDSLYTATVSNSTTTIASYKISALQDETPKADTLGTLNTNVTPSLAFLNGTLYCTVGDQVYCFNSPRQSSPISFYLSSKDPNLAKEVKSICAYADKLFYTAHGGLYASDLTEHESRLFLAGEDFGALTSYDNTLYAVCGKSIRAISVEEDSAEFTGYEIAAASSSVNRLNGAVDIARAGDLLVAADAGNKRISIIVLKQIDDDYTAAYYSTIPCLDCDDCAYTPSLIATDGSIIAVASAGENPCIYLYHFGEIEFSYCYYMDDPAIGLACVNGNCYYITEYSYGKVNGDFEEIIRPDNLPAALVADECGMLLVVNSEGKVQIYDEYTFTDCMVLNGEETDNMISAPVTSLRVDNEGNLYYLNEGTLWKNGEQLSELNDEPFVYGGDDDEIKAFVFDSEKNEIIYLYENYIVKTACPEMR